MGFFHWKNKSVDNIKPVNGFFHNSKKLILSLHEKVWKLEINPRKLGEYWQKNKLLTSGIIAIVFSLIIIIVSSRGKASATNFYSTKCLGGWQFVENATGEPNLKPGADSKDFTQKNSAILNQNVSDLYCGGFVGEIPNDISPGKVTVNLSWAITDEKFIEETPTIDTIIDSQDAIIQDENTDQILNETLSDVSDSKKEENLNNEKSSPADTEDKPTENQKPTEKPTEKIDEKANNKTEENPSSGFLFFKRVKAQEADPALSAETNPSLAEPEQTTEQKTENVSEQNEETKAEPVAEPVKAETEIETKEEPAPEKVIEKKEKPEENIEDTENSVDQIIQTEQALEEPQIVIEGFLEILYSVDGATWKHLGYVDRQNWQNTSFELEEQNLSWDAISSIQIELKSLQTFDEQPVIYLDSLWLSVSYEELQEPVEENVLSADVKKLHATNIQASGSDFTVEMINDANQGEQFMFTALPNTNVRFYLSSEPNFGFFMQIGAESTLLPTYNLTAGDFIAINTKLETTCDTETVLECLNSPDFIGALNFTLTSSLEKKTPINTTEETESEIILDNIVPIEIVEENNETKENTEAKVEEVEVPVSVEVVQ